LRGGVGGGGGWTKQQRRGVVQFFNIAIVSLALVSHATAGAWSGAFAYQRLADRGYQRVVMVLLASGLGPIWATW
jgi:hypothetical protein